MENSTSQEVRTYILGDAKMDTCEKYEGIENRVTKWIVGKSGRRIGVIYPEQKATQEQWQEVNKKFAEFIYKNAFLFQI